MEKKQAYELACKDDIVKSTNVVGYIVLSIGVLVALCSYFADVPMINFSVGVASALFGLNLVGLSYLIKAAVLYININKE